MMTHRQPRPAALLAVALLPAVLLGPLACTAKHPRPDPDDAAAVTEIDPLDYAPRDAEFILSLSPQAAYGSWLDRWFSTETINQLREYASGCKLDPGRLDRFVMFAAGEDHGMFALVGPGVGDRERLRCLESAYNSRAGESRMQVHAKHSGELWFDITDFGAGYIINDDAILVSSTEWKQTARELARGVGQRAKDGPLAPLLAEVDQTRELWFVGLINENDDANFPVQSIHGGGALSSGFELDLVTTHANADHAARAVSTMQTAIEALPLLLTQDGDGADKQRQLAEQVKRAITVTQKSTRAHLSARVDAAPMELVAARLSAMTKGLRASSTPADVEVEHQVKTIDAANGPM